MNNTENTSSQKILIAEDDKFLVKLYKENLETELPHCNVEFATDGSIAMELMDHAQPDLLILDILMPHKDGFEVLEYMRNKGYTFPIIVLTNVSQDLDKRRCAELGVTDYHIKSNTDLESLVELCKKNLHRNKMKKSS